MHQHKTILSVLVLVLTFAAASFPSQAASAFAARVVGYNPGEGYAPQFVHAETALGEPSKENPFGEETDPFNPPYGSDQVVSIGAGGWLEVKFQTPVLNHPRNLHGLDFTIFANSGFIITNEFDLTIFDWIGTPATDGSLFGQNTGSTRVLVSRDGRAYYELDQNLAPIVDDVYPTDGAGDPRVPVDPALTIDHVAGATLGDLRHLYAGSAGGCSFDIAWARDAFGRPVFLREINFVRVEVLSGKAEIDAFAKVARQSRGNRNRWPLLDR
jgi:hypothetical protein